MRIDRSNYSNLEKYLLENEVYELTISRLNYVQTVEVSPMKKVPSLKGITIKDENLASKVLGRQ